MRRWIMPQGDTPALVSPQNSARDLKAAILDAALDLAEEKGQWSAVRLHDVADRRMHPASAALLGLGWGEIDTGLCWRDLRRHAHPRRAAVA